MQLSHEVPLCLLEASRFFNNFDYGLVHLLDKYPQYYDFLKQSLKMGRDVILDNSVFELGKAFEADVFAEAVIKLQPTYYVIPDVLEDADRTVENCKNWLMSYKDLPGKSMGVVQGDTYSSIVECYKYMCAKVDKIAISFDYSYYCKLFPHENKLVSWMNGRILLINKLIRDNILDTSKPLHWLGIALPQELIYYKNMPYIESIDTSNPVVSALKNVKYKDWGLLTKETIKLADLFETPMEKINKRLLLHNLSQIRKFSEKVQL